MVTQLKGNVDGKFVIFNQTSEELWETTVPLDLDGTYVIDLTATDDAGNESYFATVLFTVDPETLHVELKFLKYRLDFLVRNFNLKSVNPWEIEKVESVYGLQGQDKGYHLERGHQCELQ